MSDPRALMQQAQKAASSATSGFAWLGGREEKWQNAADLYVQAANAFRMNKQSREAGQAFKEAANIQLTKLNEPDDAANTNNEAFKVLRTEDPEQAAKFLSAAISHYTSKGNFRRAATHQQNLAELYEVGLGDNKRAVEAYDTAAGWYEMDNAQALANKHWLKVADLAALDGNYMKSIENFEKVAKASVDNNLMRYSVKDYFFKAGICHLAIGDQVGTDRALEQYREIDPAFQGTREHMLLTDLSEAVKQGDQESFTDKLYQFDQVSKLDKWKTTLLLRVKNAIEEQGDDFS